MIILGAVVYQSIYKSTSGSPTNYLIKRGRRGVEQNLYFNYQSLTEKF